MLRSSHVITIAGFHLNHNIFRNLARYFLLQRSVIIFSSCSFYCCKTVISLNEMYLCFVDKAYRQSSKRKSIFSFYLRSKENNFPYLYIVLLCGDCHFRAFSLYFVFQLSCVVGNDGVRCPEVFYSLSSLIEHISVEHFGRVLLRCNCGKGFVTLLEAKSHQMECAHGKEGVSTARTFNINCCR